MKNQSCIDLSIHGTAYVKDDNLIYQKAEIFYNDEILKRIPFNDSKKAEIFQSEKFVQNYGFQFRYQDQYSKRQISDLWRWIKKVYFSKDTQSQEGLLNINSQLEKMYNRPCEKIYGFEVFNEKNDLLSTITWKDMSKYKLKEMFKKDQLAKEEFSRFLLFQAMSFQFQPMINLIEELKRDYFDKKKYLNFKEKEIQEVDFIYRHLLLFNQYLGPHTNEGNPELAILQQSILSFDLELHYLKLI